MWILCQADDSHEISSIILSEKQRKQGLKSNVVSARSASSAQIQLVILCELTLKAPIKTVADDIYKYFSTVFRENKTWYFIWIVC